MLYLLVLEHEVKGSLWDDLAYSVLALVGTPALVVHLHLQVESTSIQDLWIILTGSKLCYLDCS